MALLDFLFPSSKSKTAIGGLTLDILSTEEREWTGGATKYPVETGVEISDHIKQGSIRVRISGEICSAEGYYMRDTKTSMLDALELLDDMHKARKEITIVTGLTQYTNMAVERLSATRSNSDDGGGNWLKISAEFTKIEKVTSRTAEVQEQQTSGETRGRAGRTATRNTQNTSSTAQSGTPAAQQGPAQSYAKNIAVRNGYVPPAQPVIR